MAAKVPFLAVVAESFHGEAEELSLTEGTEVIVVQCDGDGWYTIHTKDSIGIFPGSYLDVVEEIRLPIKAKVALPFIELNLLPGDIVTVNDISVEGWMIEAKNTIGYCTWDYLDIILGSSAAHTDVDIVIPDIKKSANTSSLIGIKPIQSDSKIVEPSPINPVKNSQPPPTQPNNANVNRPVSTTAPPAQQRPPSVTAPNQSRPANGPGGPQGGPGPRGSPVPGQRGGPRPLSTTGGSQPNRGRPLSNTQGSPVLTKPAQVPTPPPEQKTPPAAPARRPTLTASGGSAPQPPARKPTVGAQQKPPGQNPPAQKGVSIAPSARDKKPATQTMKNGPTRANNPSITDAKPGEMVPSRYSTYRRPVSIFAGTFADDNVFHDPYFMNTMRSGAKVEIEGRFEFKATEYLPPPPAFSNCQKTYVTLMPSYIDWESKIRSAQFDI